MPKQDFNAMSGTDLVQAYNNMATRLGRPTVNKFRSKAEGVAKAQSLELEVIRADAKDKRAQTRAARPAAAPSGEGAKETLRAQMERYNQLAAEARAAGVQAKDHTSTFASLDAGERAIAKLRDKMNAGTGVARAA
jgi:hypothetical protein